MNLPRSLFFLLQRAVGSRAGARYRELRATESWTADQLRAWQEQQLAGLLQASAACPLYAPYQGAPLAGYPVLTKAALAAHFTELMDPALRAEYASPRSRRYGWVEVRSGGTTGTPSTVIHDAGFRDRNRAHRVYEYDLCHFPFGTPHYRLWGSMQDISKTRDSLAQRVMSRLSGEVLLNAFQMDDGHLAGYLEQINRGRIEHLIGYVDAIYQLARFAQRRGLPVRPLRNVMTAAGTLTDEARGVIAAVFQARVYNKYGTRDCGEIGCECDRGGLHVFARNVFVEVVDDAGAGVPPGQSGRLVVTLLGNTRFPMIRVDSGDRGSLSPQPCACGRPFPLLASVEGRASDFVRATDGGYVSPVFIRHVIGVVHGRQELRRFQLIQEAPARFTLLLQPGEGTPPEALESRIPGLRQDLQTVLGAAAELDIRAVGRIPETQHGKFRYIINRCAESR